MRESIIEDVQTGEVKVGPAGSVFIANALGSCIAVMVLDRSSRTGGIAHVMLPGKAAPNKETTRLRYAEDAVDELLGRILSSGSHIEDLTVCIAGGANVLERIDDTVCQRNIDTVTRSLQEKGVVIAVRSVGGTVRRRVRLDAARGCFFCAIGDGFEQLLWSPETGAVRALEAPR